MAILHVAIFSTLMCAEYEISPSRRAIVAQESGALHDESVCPVGVTDDGVDCWEAWWVLATFGWRISHQQSIPYQLRVGGVLLMITKGDG